MKELVQVKFTERRKAQPLFSSLARVPQPFYSPLKPEAPPFPPKATLGIPSTQTSPRLTRFPTLDSQDVSQGGSEEAECRVGGEEVIRPPSPSLPALGQRCSHSLEGEGSCTQIPKPPSEPFPRTCPAGRRPRLSPVAQRMLCTPAPPGGPRKSDTAFISPPGAPETASYFKSAEA